MGQYSKKLNYFSSYEFVIQLNIVSVFSGNGSLDVAEINEQHVGKPDQIGDCGVGCNWNWVHATSFLSLILYQGMQP